MSRVERPRRVYRVGGSVRDTLLGLPAEDRDWVVLGETPETMRKRGFTQVGADFPVFIHPDNGEAYALARKERKQGSGHRGFVTRFDADTTLEEDLIRRDITINAMAMDAAGHLVDPFGGQADLHHRVLRHVSPAFADDPLRVLRVARFLARFWDLGFRVAPETRDLMARLVRAGEMETLTAERVWLETHKALQTPSPLAYFDLLHQSGALSVLFPELAALMGVPQPPTHHPEGDVWNHTRLVLKQATRLSPDATVRFAALVHDLGKGATPAAVLPRHPNHEKTGVTLVNRLCDRLRIPNRFRTLGVATCRYHLACHRLLEMTPKKVVRLLHRLQVLRDPTKLEPFLLACRADATGRQGAEQTPYPQAARLTQYLNACLKVDTRPFVQAGMQGQRLGDAVHAVRLHRVKAIMHGAASPDPANVGAETHSSAVSLCVD